MQSLRELVNGLNEMVESGRLTESDIPDDFAWLKGALDGIDLTPQEYDATVVELARDKYCSDDVEIDDDCIFSRAENGTWVNGWLWVYDDDVEEKRNAAA